MNPRSLVLSTILALLTLSAVNCAYAEAPKKFSLETLGVATLDLDGGEDYGAGLDLGYSFNRHVTAHARVVAYETDNWRGPAIDEVSLLGEAALFRSASGATLSAIGGGEYDIQQTDAGLSAGLRASIPLSKSLSLIGEGRYRLWRDGQDDVPLVAGLRWSF